MNPDTERSSSVLGSATRPSISGGLTPHQTGGDIRVRVAWGGGDQVRWGGQIDISGGEIVHVTPLALTKDAPSTVVPVGNSIQVNHRLATNYGGVDFDLVAGDATKVRIQFTNPAAPQQKFERLYSYEELLAGTSEQLDDDKNQIWLGRVPGDELRFMTTREHLVFEPGEEFEFSIQPQLTGLRQAKTNCRMKVVKARSRERGAAIWSETTQVALDDNGSGVAKRTTLEVPRIEGVYDLWVELEPNWYPPNLGQRNPAPAKIAGKKMTVRRSVQFVVIDPDNLSIKSENFGTQWNVIQSIQPSQMFSGDKQAWSFPVLPASRRSIHNGRMRLIDSSEADSTAISDSKVVRGGVNRLSDSIRPNGQREQKLQIEPGGWLAIPIDVQKVGHPHVVEVRFDQQPGTKLGLNVVSPDEIGSSYGMDAGVMVPNSIIETKDQQPSPASHKVTIWPNSKTQYLLIANRADQQSANVIGIEVSAGPKALESQPVAAWPTIKQNRKRFAFLESPHFVEAFGATKATDSKISQPLDDWVTFHQGTKRLIEHLKTNGYQGAFVNVAADGSAIYPSRILAAGPKYDSGVFFSSGQDPIRKDVLELMLRMFERERLLLIPSLTMNAPLRELEATRDFGQSNNSVKSFDLVNFTGEQSGAQSQSLPMYNPLDHQVQSLVVQVVREIAERYQDHRSFEGLSLVCRPDSFALLPGRQWGYDPTTVERFFQFSDSVESSIAPENRQASLLSENQSQWMQWRADQMTQWYLQLSQTLKKYRPGQELYLAPVDLFQSPEAIASLSPTLHEAPEFGDVMKRFGLDYPRLNQAGGVHCLSPMRIASDETLAQRRVDLEVLQSKQARKYFSLHSSGTLFTHRGIWAHFQQLERSAPFLRSASPVIRLQQLTPVGAANRQRFIHSIRNQDSMMLVDGGDTLPMGQAAGIADLTSIFQQLPAVQFEDVLPTKRASEGDEETDYRSLPVCVRQVRHEGRDYYYAINDSPWPVRLNLKVRSAMQDLQRSAAIAQASNGGARKPSSGSYLLTLEDNPIQVASKVGFDLVGYELPPYSMVAGKSASQSISLIGFDFSLPQGSDEPLRKRLRLLRNKLTESATSQPLPVIENSSFESFGQASLSGWEFGNQPQSSVQLQANDAQMGTVALSLKSENQPVWVRSNAFAPPATGRLSVSVWLKTMDAGGQPPLRLAIEGTFDGENYYRFGSVGSLSPNAEVNQIDGQWRRFAVHFDDLPASSVSDLRVGFDLMGQGQVLVDNVEVYDRWFDENDSKAITQLLASAGPLLQSEETLDSGRRILEGYWPQFLNEYVGNEPKILPGKVAERTASEQDSQAAESQSFGDPYFPKRDLENQGWDGPAVEPYDQPRPSIFQRLRRSVPRKSVPYR